METMRNVLLYNLATPEPYSQSQGGTNPSQQKQNKKTNLLINGQTLFQ